MSDLAHRTAKLAASLPEGDAFRGRLERVLASSTPRGEYRKIDSIVADIVTWTAPDGEITHNGVSLNVRGIDRDVAEAMVRQLQREYGAALQGSSIIFYWEP